MWFVTSLYAVLSILIAVDTAAADTVSDIVDETGFSGNTSSGPPITFSTTLTADEQNAPTVSNGIGKAEFVLSRTNLNLTWRVTFTGIKSEVTGAHIHGPERPGGEAGVTINLAPTGDLVSPLKGSVILDEVQLLYFLNGRVYVNIHTAEYTVGELRGQIERIPPEETP